MIWNISIAIVTLSFVYYMFFRRSKPIPPGLKETPLEAGIPLFGVFHKIKGPLHEYLIDIGKKHGPLFRIRFGLRDILILNDFDTIKSALKDNSDIFSGRWFPIHLRKQKHDSGIVFNDGEKWYGQRTFILRVLRDFGMGKSKSVEIIQDETISLLEDLEDLEDGASVEMSHIFYYHTVNVISKFVMNKRFSKNDPDLQLIKTIMEETDKKKDLVTLIYMMYPAINSSELLYQITKPFYGTLKLMDQMFTFFQRMIDEHIKDLDLNSEGEDFMDRFLIKQHQLKSNNGENEIFTKWQLQANSMELLIAGYETTANALVWGFMFLCRHPHIQKKVYLEIVDQIGNERLATMNDKKSLNYTQAVMDEILRLSTIAPLAVMHKTLRDINLNGYFIPKNTVVFPNLFSCHTDPMIWEKPVEFYPEHFLSKDENGDWKYNPREQLIPFSIGARQCVGESLARMEYFIFFTNVLQKYEVEFAEPISDERYKEVLRGNEGFIRYSVESKFKFKKRMERG